MHIIWNPAVTLDGYIAKIDGAADWVSDQDEALFWELAKQCGCVIVGHTTYELYRGLIYPIPGATTFVLTSHPEKEESCTGVEFLKGTPQEIVAQIQVKGFDKAVLAGGSRANSEFVSAGLVDEMYANIYPLVFGEGVKLADGADCQLDLKLMSTQCLDGGVVQHRYRVRHNK